MNREATNTEKVAIAIQSLTYAEMIEIGASLRDMIGDRLSDNDQALSNAMEVADIIHSWASTELTDDEAEHG